MGELGEKFRRREPVTNGWAGLLPEKKRIEQVERREESPKRKVRRGSKILTHQADTM